jgi:hypothetical protein
MLQVWLNVYCMLIIHESEAGQIQRYNIQKYWSTTIITTTTTTTAAAAATTAIVTMQFYLFKVVTSLWYCTAWMLDFNPMIAKSLSSIVRTFFYCQLHTTWKPLKIKCRVQIPSKPFLNILDTSSIVPLFNELCLTPQRCIGMCKYRSYIINLDSRWRWVASFKLCHFTSEERTSGTHWMQS